MTENWDEIADDEKEWAGEPIVDRRRVGTVETVISVRMSTELAEQARRVARKADLTLSAYVRSLVERTVRNKVEQRVYSLDASRPSQVSAVSSTTGGPETFQIPA